MACIINTALVFVLAVTVSTVTSSDVVYYFRLNETVVRGIVKNGPCTDLATSTVQGSTPANTVQGPNSTQALNFASDNWINLGDFAGTCISDPSVCSSSGMSMSFWILVNTSLSTDRHIITTGKLDTSRGMQVFIANGHTNVVICDGTKRYPAEIDLTSSWTHVTAIYNPSGSTAADRFYVYINGVTKETARYAANCANSDQDTHLLLGHETTTGSINSRPFAIAQLAFYNKVLSQAEVQEIQANVTSGIVLDCPATTTAPPTTTPAPTSSQSGGGGGTTALTASSDGGTTTAASGGGSRSGAQQSGSDGDKRSPVVLILLSVSLFVLLVIVIIIIIACCIILPNAKGKGYKCI